jgi:hypothetical protein
MSKMAKTKTNRNVQTVSNTGGFRISSKPIVHTAANHQASNTDEVIDIARSHGARILFAIARDARTLFASWNIDWRSLFNKFLPVDRQIHLRVYGTDGIEESRVAVEPLTAMHYVTTSGAYPSYRVEIGYYQPADVWHSVAISQEIAMPPSGFAETSDTDLATIPFHVGFQQLLNLFKPTSETALAVAISRLEQRVLSNRRQLSLEEKKILQRLGFSASRMAAQRRRVDQTQRDKLSRRAGALFAVRSSSPASGFHTGWTSAGS